MSDENTKPADTFQKELEAASAAFEKEVGSEAAPEPQQEAAPEPDAETEAEIQEERQAEPAKRQVPIEALHEERRERQALARQLEELRQWAGRISQQAQEEVAAETTPDPTVDPIAALQHTQKQLEQLHRERQVQAQRSQVFSIYKSHADRLAQANPEFTEAYRNMVNTRAAQIKIAAPDLTEEQINRVIVDEELGLAARAISRGIDPAQAIYDFAATFRPAGQQQAADPVRKAEMQKVRQGVATSLATGGKAPEAELTPETVMSLKGAALRSAEDKLWKQMQSQARGGRTMDVWKR